jgi:MtN3 and saliva related transmembrane protein
MAPVEILGYCASFASGGAFLPQAIRVVRTRQTRDLSIFSVTLSALGTILWASYGFIIDSGPIVLSNMIVMPFALTTWVLTFKGLKDRASPPQANS